MGQTNQPNQSSQPPKKNQSFLRTLGVVGLVLVTILSLAFAGYTAQSPHVMTVTEQQLLTNTQSLTNTLTVTSTKTATSATTITSTTTSTTSTGYDYGYYPGGYYPYPENNCGASCPPNSDYITNYNTCNLNGPAGSNVTFECYGYVYQDSSGCIVLAVPVTNPPYYFENPVINYYGLHNLPSNSPPMGSWVTVTGQWNQGNNTSASGAACPLNYLNVASITQ